MSEVQLVPVSKGDAYLEVHPTCLEDHKANGWTECEYREEDASAGALSVADLKAALTEKGIEIPAGSRKADLQALLDASAGA